MAGDSGELMAGDEVTGIGRAGSQVGTSGDKRWWDLSLWSSWQLPQDWAEQAANSDDGGDDDGHQTSEFRRNHQHGSHTAKRLTHTVPYNTHTHTHPFNGPLSGSTRASQYQRGKTNLDFTEARDSEWQWHQLDGMQVCTSLQTDNHASTPPLSFLQAGCPSCRPTNSVKALKA